MTGARGSSRDERRARVLRLLADEKPSLVRRYPIRRLAVFGSYARGDQRRDSDVDVLVDVDPSIGLRFVDLAEELNELLGVEVDLVSTRAVRPQHWPLIERDLVDV
jgi:predicted nucleotidyltransferase